MPEPLSRARLAEIAGELRAHGYIVSRADDVIVRPTAVKLCTNAACREGRGVKSAATPAEAKACRERASVAAALAAEINMHGKGRR